MEAKGLPRSDVVKDYIEVLLDGPERRLRRLDFTSLITSNMTDTISNKCEYGLSLPIFARGRYRIQIVVVHSDIALTGIEPYRNYVLWDQVHNLSAKALNDISIGTEAWRSAGGWMRTSGEGFLGLHSAQTLVGQEWNINSYRCPANGTASFTWMPSPRGLLRKARINVEPPWSEYKTVTPQKAMECARALAPQRNATHPKLVLFGDSLMRQTFNAVASAMGMENVTAVKEFKSLMESQDWGGPSIGLDFSFQWAARHNEGRSTCKQVFLALRGKIVHPHPRLTHPAFTPSHTQ
jgi:hypothetical protein